MAGKLNSHIRPDDITAVVVVRQRTILVIVRAGQAVGDVILLPGNRSIVVVDDRIAFIDLFIPFCYPAAYLPSDRPVLSGHIWALSHHLPTLRPIISYNRQRLQSRDGTAGCCTPMLEEMSTTG